MFPTNEDNRNEQAYLMYVFVDSVSYTAYLQTIKEMEERYGNKRYTTIRKTPKAAVLQNLFIRKMDLIDIMNSETSF